MEVIDRLLTEKEAAQFLGVSVRTLQNWRRKGIGPKWYKVGRLVRYARADLYDFLRYARRRSTSDPGIGLNVAMA